MVLWLGNWISNPFYLPYPYSKQKSLSFFQDWWKWDQELLETWKLEKNYEAMKPWGRLGLFIIRMAIKLSFCSINSLLKRFLWWLSQQANTCSKLTIKTLKQKKWIWLNLPVKILQWDWLLVSVMLALKNSSTFNLVF